MKRSGGLLEHLGSLEHALDGLNADELKGLLWGRLDKTQRLAVSEALHSSDGRFRARQFQAKHGVGPKGVPTSGTHESKPSLLELFLYVDDFGRGGTALLPEDLRERLRLFVPIPAAPELTGLDDLPETVDRPRRGVRNSQSTKRGRI